MSPPPAAGLARRPARQFLWISTLLAAFACGLVTLLLSQAASPDYRLLFWRLLPWAALHLLCSIISSMLSTFRWRCLLAAYTLIVLASFSELALRVWM